jgi:hypothetical protein
MVSCFASCAIAALGIAIATNSSAVTRNIRLSSAPEISRRGVLCHFPESARMRATHRAGHARMGLTWALWPYNRCLVHARRVRRSERHCSPASFAPRLVLWPLSRDRRHDDRDNRQGPDCGLPAPEGGWADCRSGVKAPAQTGSGRAVRAAGLPPSRRFQDAGRHRSFCSAHGYSR